MRFESLHIERYGAFDQRSLTFGQAPLTVIYGPNEAGKSTSLEAIGDFLFGVPPQTPRMGVYGGDVLRLGATLSTADGRDLSLWRRKGRGKTLTGQAGVAVDEGALSRLLGGTTRDRFETLFGLDHETLRQGGAELLSAGGDFGRLIVEAGGGLRALIARLDQIDEDLAGLFTTRRHGDRAFYKATDAFLEADHAVKNATISWDQFEKTRKAHEQELAAVQQLRDARGEATRTLSQLQRLVRVVPTLGRLNQVRHTLAALGEDPSLPIDFDDQVMRIRDRLTKAHDALREETRKRARLQSMLADLQIDTNMQALEARVRDIRERTVHVTKQRADRPNRERELTEADGRLSGLRRRLGLTPSADLSSKLPAVAIIDAVVVLGGQGQQLGPQRAAAAAERLRQQAHQQQLSASIDEAIAVGHDVALSVSSDQLALLPSVEEGLAIRERQASNALETARAGLVELGLDPERPEFVAFPESHFVAEQMAAMERLYDDRAESEKDLRRAEADRDTAIRVAERLTAGGEVANAAALAAARNARSAALTPIRQAHLAGVATATPEDRAEQVQYFEQAIVGADDVADRLSAEAQRAAELGQARIRAEENEALATTARRSMVSHDEEIRRRAQAMLEAYPEAVARFPALPTLKAAAERRRGLFEQIRASDAVLEDVERQRILFISQRGALDQVEQACRLAKDSALDFEARVRRAVNALARHTEGHSAVVRDKRELSQIETLLADAVKQTETLDKDLSVWRERWARALAALGLPAEAAINDGITGANEWSAAAGILTTLETTRRRLDRMDEDEAELEVWVNTVFERLGVERPADTVAAAKMIETRWDQYQEADRKRQALEPELKLAQSQELDHSNHVRASEADLVRLAGLAAVDQAGLDGVCEALKHRRDLLGQEAQLLEALQASGDGLPEVALRSDWAGREVDELRATLTVETANSDSLGPALEAAVQAEVAARTQIEKQSRAPEGAAQASREAALTDIHDVVERYVKLSLARGLVEAGINKVRAAQQDPLIVRAGALFAAMSKDAFTGVAADVDAKGAPAVVGLGADGRVTPIALMSDGSRDQLYLAFRLAGVEAYCRSAEPLPFVADDILVHFDDDRTEATLKVLSDFGHITQVLLFTHHLSVKRAAQALEKSGGAEVIQLSRG